MLRGNILPRELLDSLRERDEVRLVGERILRHEAQPGLAADGGPRDVEVAVQHQALPDAVLQRRIAAIAKEQDVRLRRTETREALPSAEQVVEAAGAVE